MYTTKRIYMSFLKRRSKEMCFIITNGIFSKSARKMLHH